MRIKIELQVGDPCLPTCIGWYFDFLTTEDKPFFLCPAKGICSLSGL